MVAKQTYQEDAGELNYYCDGRRMKALAGAALVWLEQNHEHVNSLNVFPVPDGDTGTNMLLTMREAYRQVEHMDEAHVGKVTSALAYGALMGARGNSGTILSQMWEGFASALKDKEVFEAPDFAAACAKSTELAYAAVQEPVEGTILTVARAAGEAVVSSVNKGESDLVDILKVMVLAARDQLRDTPELLPILKQSGVVDSGGQGYLYLLEGMLQYLSGKTFIAPVSSSAQAQAWQEALEPEDEEGYGYDVQFRIHGQELDVNAIRDAINSIGWSTVVVGNERVVKVHVHTHDPGEPISYAIGLGVQIDDVVVENMQMQYHEYLEHRTTSEAEKVTSTTGVAVIAVVPGGGLQRLFLDDLQATRVINGGQAMTPSTSDFLKMINDISNEKIVLLPNNKNIILTAQQAAKMAEGKQVTVVPTRTIPQGISAMLAYTGMIGSEDLEAVTEELSYASQHVLTAEITTAVRSVELDNVVVREGQYIGLLDGQLLTAQENIEDVLADLMQKSDPASRELVTLYYGSDIKKADAKRLAETFAEVYPDLTFDVIEGGQPFYFYIISIE